MTHDEQEEAHDHAITRRTFVVRLSGLLGASAVGSVLASCQSLAQQPTMPTQSPSATPSNPTTSSTATTPVASPGTTLYVYRGHTSAVSDVSWSPDSTRIASAWYTDVEIFNAATGRKIVSYPTSLPPNISQGSTAVAWSPDETTIVSAAAHTGHSVQFWDAHTGQPLHYFTGSPLIAVAWSPNGKLVAIQSFGSSMKSTVVEVRDATTGQVFLSNTTVFIPTPDREQTVFGYIRPHNITWSPDSRYIAVPNNDTTVEIWDVIQRRLAYTYRGHTDIVYAVAWSPDGTRIASVSNDKTVRVWQAI